MIGPQQLRELRESRDLTQFALGTLVGVSQGLVSKWENGSKAPGVSRLSKLASSLGVSVDELAGLRPPAMRPPRSYEGAIPGRVEEIVAAAQRAANALRELATLLQEVEEGNRSAS